MAYLTEEQILQRVPEQLLIELTDDLNTGSINSSRVSKAISDAESLIDSYLSERYELPLSIVPERLEKLCFDIAMYFIYAGRYDNEMPHEIRQRYSEAFTELQNIALGQLTLSGITALTGSIIAGSKSDDDRIFTDDVLDLM